MSKSKKHTIHEVMKTFGNSSFMSATKALENSSFMSAAKALENSSVMSAAKALENSSFMSAVKALENSSVMSATKALENSSFMSAAKALENSSVMSAAKALENSSFMSAVKALENSSVMSAAKALENSSVMSAAKALENSSFMSATKALENSSFMSAIKALQNSSRFASFNELAEKFSSQIVGPLTLGEAYQVVAEGYLHTSGSTETERLEILSDQVDLLVKKAPQGALSKEFCLGLFLTLFLFWFSQNTAMQSEEKVLFKIEQLETTISQQLAELKSYEEVDTFYVVIRGVNLRVKPNTKSEVINTLYPNEKVKLIKRSSKWIKVEYFNHTENAYTSGWVYKKYLKILNPKKKRK